MAGNHIYLTEDNAEETLERCLMYLKSKTSQEARTKAFDDCTNYWKTEIENIINSDYANETKVNKIRTLFSVEHSDD